MSIALTPTPSTFNRAIAGSGNAPDVVSSCLGMTIPVWGSRITSDGSRSERFSSSRHWAVDEGTTHLRLDPLVGTRHPVLEGDLWLPSQHLAESCIVGVAPPHALRP